MVSLGFSESTAWSNKPHYSDDLTIPHLEIWLWYGYPLVNVYSLLLNMAIEKGDLPKKHGDVQ